jgi:hypothetical protein
MRKKIVYPFFVLIALCAINIRVHAQDFGAEQDPCPSCYPPDCPDCWLYNSGGGTPIVVVVDPYVPIVPPPAQPTGPCTTNPCLCSSTGCGVTPSPATCQKYPCQCTPAKCTVYDGSTPNPQLPQATVTVTPSLSSSGPTVEYVTATAPSGSIFSWGSFGVIFAINPQDNTLNAASGGGTSANPWNVNSWVAGSGATYSQVQVFNSNAPGIVAFTIICQLTPSGSSVPATQSINVQYSLSTNSCIITEN